MSQVTNSEDTVISVESLSLVAKLLATENIIVEHRKVSTAAFNIQLRMLILPMWQDMTKSLYSMLVAHEVGHALYTPAEYMTEADALTTRRKINSATFRMYMNIIEDARIERKMKVTYPGLRRDFSKAYAELHARGFFGLNGVDPADLSFINRVNLYFKIGNSVRIPFKSDEERSLVRRMETAETFADVVQLAEESYFYSKDRTPILATRETELPVFGGDENTEPDPDASASAAPEDFTPDDELTKNPNSKAPSQDDLDDSAGQVEEEEKVEKKEKEEAEDEDDGALADEFDRPSELENSENKDAELPTTEQEFQNRMQRDLVDMTKHAPHYIRWPKNVQAKDYIISYRELDAIIKRTQSLASKDSADRRFQKFRQGSRSAVAYLVQEFEARKAASCYARAKEAKTGAINPNKLHGYQFTDDIFKRLVITPTGKSHGLVMFVDLSSSMANNIKGTIEQLLNLVMFCRQAGIPHRVYGFTSAPMCRDMTFKQAHAEQISRKLSNIDRAEGEIAIHESFWLLEFFHEKMRSTEFTQMATNLLENYYMSKFDMPEILMLNDTPLNETIVLARTIINEFRAETKSEIVNTVFLTDGGATSHAWWSGGTRSGSYQYKSGTFIITDPITKITTKVSSAVFAEYTTALFQMLRKMADVQVHGFYITANPRDLTQYTSKTNRDVVLQHYRDKKWVILTETMGCDVMYFIQGAKALEVEVHTMDSLTENSSNVEIKRAFTRMAGSKRKSRVVLSRFIESIS